MRILITGCNGFIGRNLVKLLGKENLIDAVSRKELDLLDGDAVQKFFGLDPHLESAALAIIDAAGYGDTVEQQENPTIPSSTN